MLGDRAAAEYLASRNRLIIISFECPRDVVSFCFFFDREQKQRFGSVIVAATRVTSTTLPAEVAAAELSKENRNIVGCLLTRSRSTVRVVPKQG